MRKEIPTTYYRCALVGTWIFAVICIVGAWIFFMIGGNPSFSFILMSDIFLSLTMLWLTVMLFMSPRPDFKKKGIVALILSLVHIFFFVSLVIYKFVVKDANRNEGLWYLGPGIHTLILLIIIGVGIYLTTRDKYVFKQKRADAAAAFGGEVEDDTKSVVAPTDPQKPARDEKTGIVSL